MKVLFWPCARDQGGPSSRIINYHAAAQPALIAVSLLSCRAIGR
jgi:hypothetical protein